MIEEGGNGGKERRGGGWREDRKINTGLQYRKIVKSPSILLKVEKLQS